MLGRDKTATSRVGLPVIRSQVETRPDSVVNREKTAYLPKVRNAIDGLDMNVAPSRAPVSRYPSSDCIHVAQADRKEELLMTSKVLDIEPVVP